MFLATENLNEGGSCKKCNKEQQRELNEGKNPKSSNDDWHSARSSSHVNEHWQQLRK
jgi:hypothetical protein